MHMGDMGFGFLGNTGTVGGNRSYSHRRRAGGEGPRF